MIPLSVPNISGNEWQYVKECLDTEWVSSAGTYVELFEKNIAQFTKAKYAVACVNGTSALHIALSLSGVNPGDEVIVPTLTFIAPVNAINYNGADPVFMDVDKYYNIDVDKTISFLNQETFMRNGYTYNKKTKKKISAIVPVHMWGNASNLIELLPICDDKNIAIVEDASESLGTFYNSKKYNGKHTGTIGILGCLSFNGNKIITSGGGGMILTDNFDLSERARYFTTQAKDDPVHYIHHEIGYNYRLTNVQAAMGVGQLEQLPLFLKRKKEVYEYYLKEVDSISGLKIASVPNYSDNNHWLNVLQIDVTKREMDREALMKFLHGHGIQTRPPWYLNHLQNPYKHCQSYKIDNAHNSVNYSLCLPSSSNLTESDLEKIIKYLNE